MTTGEAFHIDMKEGEFSQIGEMCRGKICRELDVQTRTGGQSQLDHVRAALCHPVQEHLATTGHFEQT